jgi:hypothetical protein
MLMKLSPAWFAGKRLDRGGLGRSSVYASARGCQRISRGNPSSRGVIWPGGAERCERLRRVTEVRGWV